jgi:hypothetical protein
LLQLAPNKLHMAASLAAGIDPQSVEKFSWHT